MKKQLIFVGLVLGLAAVAAAQQTEIRDIAIDKLLEGVRVTVACGGEPNVSSFISEQPPAIVLDFMGGVSKLDRDRYESKFYPVSAVTVEPSKAATGVRIAIRLRDLVDHRITRENGLVVVDLGLAPVPPPPKPMPGDPFVGKRLTLYVKDADISDVLRMIASQFDLNILVTQDVKSLVTVRLADVPLRTGLDALLKAGLCNMVQEKDGIMVVKPEKKEMYGEVVTRIFNLDYVEAADAAQAVARLLTENGNAEPGFRRVSEGSGSERTGVLIVTDVPQAIERIAMLIAEIDQPVPQIAIEAKFVETTRTTEDRFGIDWQIAASARSGGGFDPTDEFAIPLVFNELLLGKVTLDQMRASLEILATRGNSRLLANPRTVTLDNQTSMVSMGLEVPLREVRKDAETGEITYTWRARDVPIRLEVTPHVTSDGMISMHVKPSIEAIVGYMGPPDDQQPIVAKREAETQVMVADGEVVVIGGLVKDEESRNVGKIPLLGDIPILGHLFKKTSIRREKNDLMIFIIPRVLPAGG